MNSWHAHRFGRYNCRWNNSPTSEKTVFFNLFFCSMYSSYCRFHKAFVLPKQCMNFTLHCPQSKIKNQKVNLSQWKRNLFMCLRLCVQEHNLCAIYVSKGSCSMSSVTSMPEYKSFLMHVNQQWIRQFLSKSTKAQKSGIWIMWRIGSTTDQTSIS